jgi:mono/diheme cytochrome c family protein
MRAVFRPLAPTVAALVACAVLSGCAWLLRPSAAPTGVAPAAQAANRASPAAVPAAAPAAPPAAASALGETDVAALRERIREHAKAHCGTCHQSSRPSHKAAAIAIYDLDRADWHSTLTVPRLQQGFPRRLNSRLDEAGRRDLQAFIAHEVALRQPR